MARVAWIVLLALVLTACGNGGPQRPSQRKGATPSVDSAQLALLQLNRQMALAADEQVRLYAQAQKEPYVLLEQGTWVYLAARGDEKGSNPIQDEEWTVHIRTFSLSGQLYSDTEQTVRIGHYELPSAIENNLGEWHHGTQARLIAPWYAAYGLQGTEYIPPYENVIMEIEMR